jgi:thiol:disulfide interchange protein
MNGRPGNFFIIFRVPQYFPYIAIGLLVFAIAIWIIFAIKKFRWAKILAIVLTIFVLITGLFSLAPLLLRGNPPRDGQGFRDRPIEVNREIDTNYYNCAINYKWIIDV